MKSMKTAMKKQNLGLEYKVQDKEKEDMAKEMNEYEIGEPSGESFSQISISNVVAGQWVIVNYI